MVLAIVAQAAAAQTFQFSLSLLDDLTAEAIERMKAEGFEPAFVVETSPNDFQVWLNHGEILSVAMSTVNTL